MTVNAERIAACRLYAGGQYRYRHRSQATGVPIPLASMCRREPRINGCRR